MKTTDEILLDGLRDIRRRFNAGELLTERRGICSILGCDLLTGEPGCRAEVMNRLRGLYVDWPYFSGDADYPVGGHNRYWQGYDSATNWDCSTLEGYRRARLLDWLIDNLTIAGTLEAARRQPKYTAPLAAPTITVELGKGGPIVKAVEVVRNLETGALLARVILPEDSSDD